MKKFKDEGSIKKQALVDITATRVDDRLTDVRIEVDFNEATWQDCADAFGHCINPYKEKVIKNATRSLFFYKNSDEYLGLCKNNRILVCPIKVKVADLKVVDGTKTEINFYGVFVYTDDKSVRFSVCDDLTEASQELGLILNDELEDAKNSLLYESQEEETEGFDVKCLQTLLSKVPSEAKVAMVHEVKGIEKIEELGQIAFTSDGTKITLYLANTDVSDRFWIRTFGADVTIIYDNTNTREPRGLNN